MNVTVYGLVRDAIENKKIVTAKKGFPASTGKPLK